MLFVSSIRSISIWTRWSKKSFIVYRCSSGVTLVNCIGAAERRRIWIKRKLVVWWSCCAKIFSLMSMRRFRSKSIRGKSNWMYSIIYASKVLIVWVWACRILIKKCNVWLIASRMKSLFLYCLIMRVRLVLFLLISIWFTVCRNRRRRVSFLFWNVWRSWISIVWVFLITRICRLFLLFSVKLKMLICRVRSKNSIFCRKLSFFWRNRVISLSVWIILFVRMTSWRWFSVKACCIVIFRVILFRAISICWGWAFSLLVWLAIVTRRIRKSWSSIISKWMNKVMRCGVVLR